MAAVPGKAYDASGWELWAPLRPLYDKGEHTELRARLQDLVAANPRYPMLAYNLMQREPERPHCRRDRSPATRGLCVGEVPHRCDFDFDFDADSDSDSDSIRDETSFEALIGE